jgi:mono/diheme cytochrome c family protein
MRVSLSRSLNVAQTTGLKPRRTGGRMIILLGLWTIQTLVAHAQSPQIERGRYLVRVGGCDDCHTPGHLLGKPDETRFLGGSDVAFEVPSLGIFVPPNLTPDKETGLGGWSKEQIVTAITTGVRPDGRVLAPIMPWRGLAALTKADADAIADYLHSLPAVSHQVPGPFGAGVTPPVPVMRVVFPKDRSSAG